MLPPSEVLLSIAKDGKADKAEEEDEAKEEEAEEQDVVAEDGETEAPVTQG